jgi:hypothetical protein
LPLLPVLFTRGPACETPGSEYATTTGSTMWSALSGPSTAFRTGHDQRCIGRLEGARRGQSGRGRSIRYRRRTVSLPRLEPITRACATIATELSWPLSRRCLVTVDVRARGQLCSSLRHDRPSRACGRRAGLDGIGLSRISLSPRPVVENIDDETTASSFRACFAARAKSRLSSSIATPNTSRPVAGPRGRCCPSLQGLRTIPTRCAKIAEESNKPQSCA